MANNFCPSAFWFGFIGALPLLNIVTGGMFTIVTETLTGGEVFDLLMWGWPYYLLFLGITAWRGGEKSNN